MDNIATHGMLFTGSNSGDIDLDNFVFTNNDLENALDGHADFD